MLVLILTAALEKLMLSSPMILHSQHKIIALGLAKLEYKLEVNIPMMPPFKKLAIIIINSKLNLIQTMTKDIKIN